MPPSGHGRTVSCHICCICNYNRTVWPSADICSVRGNQSLCQGGCLLHAEAHMPGLQKSVSKSRKDINTSADPLLGTKVRSALQPAPTHPCRGPGLESLVKPTVKPRISASFLKSMFAVTEADVFCFPCLWASVFAHSFCN